MNNQQLFLKQMQLEHFNTLLMDSEDAFNQFSKDEQEILMAIRNYTIIPVGLDIFCSWGVSAMYPTRRNGNVGYTYEVSARLFSGKVSVIYDKCTDRYDIYLGDVLTIQEDYLETFAGHIDRIIETGDDLYEYAKFITENLFN